MFSLLRKRYSSADLLGRTAKQRRPASIARRRLLSESLEDRRLLAAVDVTGSTIRFQSNPGEQNDLVVSEVGGVITLRDATTPISASSDFAVVDSNEVTIPTTGITALSISLGDGNDSFDASGIMVSSGLTRLSINGGDGDDNIIGSDIDDFITAGLGNDVVDSRGQVRADQLTYNRDSDITLNDKTVMVDGDVDTFTMVEVINLGGGDGDNTFDASATTSASGLTFGINFTGRGGDDTLISGGVRGVFRDFDGQNVFIGGSSTQDSVSATSGEDMTLTDDSLTVGASVNSLVGIEVIGLLGDDGDNVIDMSAVTVNAPFTNLQMFGFDGDDVLLGGALNEIIRDTGGANTIDGSGGFDQLLLSADADMVFENTSFTMAGELSTFTNMERLSVTGGSSDNLIDASAVTEGFDVIFFTGGAGNDTLLGSELVDIFSDPSGDNVIEGNGAPVGRDDEFVGSGQIVSVSDNVIAYDANSVVISEVNRVRFTGTSGNDVYDASALTTNSDIGFFIVESRAGDDAFSPPVEVQWLFDGESGFDTIDMSHFVLPPVVDITGPGLVDGEVGTVNSINNFRNVDELTLPQLNEAPVISVVETSATLQDKASPGDDVSLLAAFTDANTADSHTAVIDWGDGTQTNALVDSVSGEITATHSYATGGVFIVTVTLSDGTEAVAADTTAVVSGARLTAGGKLEIVGTSNNDLIRVRRHGDQVKVLMKARNNPSTWTTFERDAVETIAVLACEGNDRVSIDHRLHVATTIDAGAGNDYVSGGGGNDLIRGGEGRDSLYGGGGDDILLGGDGRDKLFGSWGRDLLIGGLGKDFLAGGFFDQDILIGGSTTHDDNDEALNAIQDEWTSSKSLTVRKQNLIDGTGDASPLNGSVYLDSMTVLDDGERDLVWFRNWRDWVVAS